MEADKKNIIEMCWFEGDCIFSAQYVCGGGGLTRFSKLKDTTILRKKCSSPQEAENECRKIMQGEMNHAY